MKFFLVVIVISVVVLLLEAGCGISPNLLPQYTAALPDMQTTPLGISATKLHEWILPYGTISDAKWAMDSSKFSVVGFFGGATIYDPNTYQVIWNLEPVQIHAATSNIFTPDGKSIVIFNASGVQIWDILSHQLLTEITDENGAQNCIRPVTYGHDAVFSQDGHTLFLSVEDNSDKRTTYTKIEKWDTTSWHCMGTLLSTEGHPRSLALSPNGRFLAIGISEGISDSGGFASGTEKGHTLIWDILDNKQHCTVDEAPSTFAPGNIGSLVVFKSGMNQSNSWENQVIYLNEQCQPSQILLDLTPPYPFLSPLSFSPNGQMLALGRKKIWILDANSGSILVKIPDAVPNTPSDSHVTDILSFSPDGRFLGRAAAEISFLETGEFVSILAGILSKAKILLRR